jgi:predicted transcriptional regulator
MAEEHAETALKSIELATELTIAWLNNPNVRATADEVPTFLRKMYETVGDLAKPAPVEPESTVPEYVPAVPVRTSVKPGYIISLIDSRKLKSLKRHLAINGLTPAEYRERYGLKPDYPMVAAAYSEKRREVAKAVGLGQNRRAVTAPEPVAPPPVVAEPVVPAAAKATRRATKPKAAAAPKPVKKPRVKKAETAPQEG